MAPKAASDSFCQRPKAVELPVGHTFGFVQLTVQEEQHKPPRSRLRRLHQWASTLHQWGYVVLLVDSFTPRGQTNICNVGFRVDPQYARMPDA